MKGCRPLTEQEFRTVLQCFSGDYQLRDRSLFLLGCLAGYRVSEMLSLRISDVMKHGEMLERVTVRRQNMKKKTEGRTVILHPLVQESLALWIAELGSREVIEGSTFVFKSRKDENRPISRTQAWRVLRQAYEAAGLSGNLGTHTCRKTFADRLYDKFDKDLAKLQKALNHANVNSTISYLSFKEDAIDEAILSL